MSFVVKLIFIISVCFFSSSQVYAWETLTEMLEEARQADGADSVRLGTVFENKEAALTELVRNKPESRSTIADLYEKDALALIAYNTEFYGEGAEVITPWTSIAYTTLGTDDTKKCLIGLVALADVRGLSTFRTTLDQLLAGVEIEEGKNPDEMAALTARFATLKISGT